MISGFNDMTKVASYPHHEHLNSGFPVPFNLPSVLHNLLYKDMNLDLDAKQKDLHTALHFSYESLHKVLKEYTQQEHKYKSKLVQEPNNKELIEKIENIELDKMEAVQDFKHILEAMAEVLTKEQYEKLLKASNLPV